MTPKRTINALFDNAYQKWCKKIVEGEIPTTNERTIQVYFAYILLKEVKTFGRNNKYDIKIHLEADAGMQNTSKTKGNARCDIMLELKQEKPKKTYIAIVEMKCLKKKRFNQKEKPSTEKRLSVLQDIENLENYKADLKYEIVYTDHRIYPHPSKPSVKHNIGEGGSFNDKGKNKFYTFSWDEKITKDTEHFFLKLKVN